MKPTSELFDGGRDEWWWNAGLLIARVGFGGTLILRHGLAKIPALFADPVQFLDPLGLGPADIHWTIGGRHAERAPRWATEG